VRTRASALVQESAWLSIRLTIKRFSSNLRWTYYTSLQVACDTYFPCSLTTYTRARARVRACAWLKHSRIFGRILFKFAWHILQMTTRYMGYIRIMFTHRGHTHERARASAHLINCSLIYGRLLLKFAVNILQLTTSSKGYVLFMFTHHACEPARVSARVVTHSIIFGRILFKCDGHILQMTTSYPACPRVRACVCERACASIQQIPRRYMNHISCVWMHVLTARTSVYSRICQARDGQWLVNYNYACLRLTIQV
jgi:hypothetical protein